MERIRDFQTPPPGYGNVAFYWWMGETVTKERLAWQLDKLKGKKFSGLQINYTHCEDGGIQWGLTELHEPRVFTEAWWELIGWFLEEAGKQGISISLSDYTLGPPGQGYYMDTILREHPDMSGNRLLGDCRALAAGERFVPPTDVLAVQFVARNGQLTELTGRAEFTAPEAGTAVCVRVQNVPLSLDVLHPDSGREMVRVAFQIFEERFPGRMGEGLNFFFSDELNLGIEGNLWCRDFPERFRESKGYDLLPEIAGLYCDIGARTEKIRLDYRDVMVALEEARYFEPIYAWQQARGMTYGCDHGGRGKDVLEFGDYFRTQKYNQGPGCDQPNLASDVVKNKVASSIAHLYQRPRTWLEGFYGSGWGTGSGQVADAIFRNFAQGQNLLSLHAFYYSTLGGYWEWAPPCNHIRMPYWACMDGLLACSERLSWLLTRGQHVCDVAIVYPVAAMEADAVAGQEAVRVAFSLGEALYGARIDFDYIDFESIQNGHVEGACLHAGGERYPLIVLPAMAVARYGMLERLAELVRHGGHVVVVGCLPRASDRAGREDAQLDALCRTFADGLVASVPEAVEAIRAALVPDVLCESEAPLYFQHRQLEEGDLYFLYGAEKGSPCSLRATGTPLLLDPWTGAVERLQATQSQGRTHFLFPLEKEAPALLLLSRQNVSAFPEHRTFVPTETIALPEEWGCTLVPTLDNHWGDFRLPASEALLGAEVREAMVCQDGKASRGVFGFGEYWDLLALDRASDGADIGARFAASEGDVFAHNCAVRPYGYSLRYGVAGDPGPQGYHGLKGRISNDFLALGRRVQRDTDYAYEDEGKVYYLKSFVYAKENATAFLITGEAAPAAVWINGAALREGCRTLRLWKGYNQLIIKFNGPVRTHVLLSRTREPLWNSLRYPLAMDWYENPDLYRFQRRTDTADCRIAFSSPPGMRALCLYAEAEPSVLCGGQTVAAVETGKRLFSAREYRVECARETPEEIVIALRTENEKRGADLVPEPIRFECGEGRISLGDWSRLDGLRAYSGGLCYRTTVTARDVDGARAQLSLGTVRCACTLRVNGVDVGSRAAPPFVFDVSASLRDGENAFEITVYNSLANHYSTIPTRYRGDLCSGLLGHVTLELARGK